jgi:hypothetical protein
LNGSTSQDMTQVLDHQYEAALRVADSPDDKFH